MADKSMCLERLNPIYVNINMKHPDIMLKTPETTYQHSKIFKTT